MPADASALKPPHLSIRLTSEPYESPRPAVTIVTAKALPRAMNRRRFRRPGLSKNSKRASSCSGSLLPKWPRKNGPVNFIRATWWHWF